MTSLHAVIPAQAGTQGSAFVIPAKAGTQGVRKLPAPRAAFHAGALDSRLRGNDGAPRAALHAGALDSRLRGNDGVSGLRLSA
jgi:hypothetical protein